MTHTFNYLFIYESNTTNETSKLCSQEPSVYVHPSNWRTNFRTHSSKLAKLRLLYSLTLGFSDIKLEDKKFWTEEKQAFPEFNLLLILSQMSLSFVGIYSNIWICCPLKRVIRCPYILSLSLFRMTRRNHMLCLLCIYV
jgi:hypothetical protein